MRAHVFALLGLTMLVSGCSTQAAARSAGAESVSATTPISSRVMPLDAYRLSDAERTEISAARRILLRQCVAEFGIQLPEHKPVPETGPVTRTERRYGISDAALAARDGYHLGDRDPRRVDGRDRWLHDVAPDVETLLTGELVEGSTARPHDEDPTLLLLGGHHVPRGGCIAEAKVALQEPGTDPNDVVDRLDVRSWDLSRESQVVRQAATAWSACMRRAGYDYPDPIEAGNDDRFQGSEVGDQEITVATNDIRCKKETNIIDIWFGQEVEIQRRLVSENIAELEKVKKRELVTLRIARQILKS